jgi:hypothetical protein
MGQEWVQHTDLRFHFREYPRIQLARVALVRSTNTAVVHLEQSLLSLWYQGLLLTPTFFLYEEILNLILNASSIVCKFVVVFSFLMCVIHTFVFAMAFLYCARAEELLTNKLKKPMSMLPKVHHHSGKPAPSPPPGPPPEVVDMGALCI